MEIGPFIEFLASYHSTNYYKSVTSLKGKKNPRNVPPWHFKVTFNKLSLTSINETIGNSIKY